MPLMSVHSDGPNGLVPEMVLPPTGILAIASVEPSLPMRLWAVCKRGGGLFAGALTLYGIGCCA